MDKRLTKLAFNKKSPCENCPYRKDAPLQYWAKEEFEKTLASEMDYMGKVYGCHKQDGEVCVGWLINQRDRDYPSNALRMHLIRQAPSMEHIEGLGCKHEMFKTVEEMCRANFPELLDEGNG